MWNWLFTTRQHAIIDYIWSAALPAIPRLLGWNRQTTRVLDGVAAVGAVQATLTDFEGGVKGVIPMQCHLANDALVGAGLLTAAAIMTDQKPQVRLGLAVLGLIATSAALLTEPIPRGQGRERAKATAKTMRSTLGESAGRLAGATNPRRRRANPSNADGAARKAGKADPVSASEAS